MRGCCIFDLSLAELIPYLCLPLFHFPASPMGSLVLCGFTTDPCGDTTLFAGSLLFFLLRLPAHTLQPLYTSHTRTLTPGVLFFPLFCLSSDIYQQM